MYSLIAEPRRHRPGNACDGVLGSRVSLILVDGSSGTPGGHVRCRSHLHGHPDDSCPRRNDLTSESAKGLGWIQDREYQ